MNEHSDLSTTFIDSCYGAEHFNTCKALGYEKLGADVTEGLAYLVGKAIYEEILDQEAEKRRAERERERRLKEQERLLMEERQNAKKLKPEDGLWILFWVFICCPAILVGTWFLLPYLWGRRGELFSLICNNTITNEVGNFICMNPSELYNLICNNIFFIALFLIPSTIIFVGHKIETKKKQNSAII